MSRSKKLIVTALFLIGACILLYPAVSNKLAERHQAEMISRYEQTVEELPKTDMKSEWEKAVKYNESVTGMSVEDPFILGSGSVLPGNYKDVLNVEEKEGVMGYIEIPAIDVMLPIYHGVSERVLRRGVGHMETTALPIGGKGTHSVLASHRGLSTAKLFTDLDRMKEGDLFYIHVLDHLLTYEVDQISVIEPEDTDALRPIADKEYITLLTCTPYGVNSHRLLGLIISDSSWFCQSRRCIKFPKHFRSKSMKQRLFCCSISPVWGSSGVLRFRTVRVMV